MGEISPQKQWLKVMNFYNKISPILHRRFIKNNVPFTYKPMFVAYFRTRGVKQSISGVQGFSQLLSKNKKTEDTEKTKLSWNELKNELNKMPSDKKEIYLEALVRGIISSDPNYINDKGTKKKFFSFSRVLTFGIVSVVILYFVVGFKVTSSNKNLGSMLFSNSREIEPDKTDVTFKDVKGMDEARSELVEIVNYLREPEKYMKLGGKLPKGVMLIGPPGTGKTLLARAIAGEANVPFFHTSGSEFDEVLVGQGAKRVRDLFKKAKSRAPCIIFIDEIDSVGSKRVSNTLHPFANQTINQLLTEMDGFNKNEGIIVIGATNRFQDLDNALLRPGRFDVRVNCPKPDLSGRKEMFDFYLSKITHGNVNVDILARTTIGFTGADIQNVVNQAALKAATEDSHYVMQKHLEEARDRVLMGPSRIKGKMPDEKVTKYTAYHEAGHTLVAMFTPHAVPLHKVTIIPRGNSLGLTSLMPKNDQYQTTKAEILAQLDVLMGGRVAEELIFGEDFITTGASNDLRKATIIAKAYVKQYGMSETVGLRDYELDNNTQHLVKTNNLSQQTSEKIDLEIDRIMNESYARAKSLLISKATEHKRLAEALLEYETLTVEEVEQVINGKSLKRQPTERLSGKKNERNKQTKNLDTKSLVTEALKFYLCEKNCSLTKVVLTTVLTYVEKNKKNTTIVNISPM
uniref:GST C-terminal domain-containing protein n=1 Tax=Strongyloides stercoralis TaxID=6248 RepID=A0AAF5I1B7_STRER